MNESWTKKSRDDVSLKNVLKELSGRERIEYLWEYYKVPILLVVLGLIILAFSIAWFLSRKTTYFTAELVDVTGSYYEVRKLGTDIFQDYLLEDTLVRRPVFVKYRWTLSYVVEGLILLLAVAGIWFGRKSRFLWLCLSCMAFDMFIHVGLGFGLNEVFIMTPHYMFVLPIATAFLFRDIQARWLRISVVVLMLYLFIYNGYLLTDFLLSPIRATI